MRFSILILTVPQPAIPRCWGDDAVVTRVADILVSLNLDVVVRQVSTEAELRDLISELRPSLVIPNGYRLPSNQHELFIAEVLETMHVPFLGSGPEGLSCISKSSMKIKLSAADVSTPQGLFFTGKQTSHLSGLRLPIVLKPDEGAESIGIRIAKNFAQFKEAATDLITQYGAPIVVEEWRRNKEFTVAVLGNGTSQGIFPLEIDTPNGYSFVTNEVKERCIEDTVRGRPDFETTVQIQTLIRTACAALHILDWARLDVLQDEAGDFFIIDINPIPGLRPGPLHPSYFPMCLYHHLGFSYDDTIIALVGVTINRWGLLLPDDIASAVEKQVGQLAAGAGRIGL